MEDRDHPNAGTREMLLQQGRALLAENANFTVNTLLTKANLTRAQFRRFFSGKGQLLAALAAEDVKDLSGILEAVQPVVQELKVAVGAPAQPAHPAPAADAWLERRLRVFERALAAMEKRQENAEQILAREIALLGERLDAPASSPAPQTPVAFALPDPEPAPELAPEPRLEPKAKPVFGLATKTAVHIEEMSIPESSVELSDEKLIEETSEKISEKEISDFLAHARVAASNAALAENASRPRGRSKAWIAWGGVAAVLLLLLGTGLLLAGRALGHAEPTATAGLSHRQVAQSGLARVIALADSGNAQAQTMLAISYLRGIGIAGDETAAMRWSKAAAAQGQPVAEYLLGTLYLEGNRDDGQAVHWFQAAATQGNVKAMHNLGIAYAEGLGVDKDPVQAVSWFVRAAGQGYRDSEFDLGVLYERGLGVPQDATAALKWYLIAAGQGDTPSAARAQFLKTQMDASDVKAATDAAATFTPLPVGAYANDISSPTREG